MPKRLLLFLLFALFTVPLAAQDDLTPYEIALQRIEEARISGAIELNLSGLGLTRLPPEVWELTQLEHLTVYSNQLGELPPEIGQLIRLHTLEANNNRLTSLPPEIGQLSQLQELHLPANQLTVLPRELWQLTKLQRLSVGHNQLISLPSEIGQLVNLKMLSLNNNQLSALPSEIRHLANLQELYLATNQLTNLPSEIGQLTNLCYLDLGFNKVYELPTELHLLTKLTNTTECQFAGLYLDKNPLITPPPEVIAQGTAAILDYLRNQAWYHTQRLMTRAAGGVGLLAGVILLARGRYRRLRKPKKKREN